MRGITHITRRVGPIAVVASSVLYYHHTSSSHSTLTPLGTVSTLDRKEQEAPSSSSPSHRRILTGPGASDISESGDILAEHRTKQFFRLRRSASSSPSSSLLSSSSASSSSLPPSTVSTKAAAVTTTPPPPSPPLLVLPGADSDQYFLGCNVRCMLGWCKLSIARAYAFGLYADAESLSYGAKLARREKELLSSSSSSSSSLPPPNTTTNNDPLTALLDAKEQNPTVGELSLVLVMAREIPGDHLAHGFRNSVIARLQKKQQQQKQQKEKENESHQQQSGDNNSRTIKTQNDNPTDISKIVIDRSAALNSGKEAAGLSNTGKHKNSSSGSSGGNNNESQPLSSQLPPSPSAAARRSELDEVSGFASAFEGTSLLVGDEISLVWKKDGTLLTSIAGVPIPSLEAHPTHPSVIRAIFDVYCGENSASARARDTFQKNYKDIVVGHNNEGMKSELDKKFITRIVLKEHASRVK